MPAHRLLRLHLVVSRRADCALRSFRPRTVRQTFNAFNRALRPTHLQKPHPKTSPSHRGHQLGYFKSLTILSATDGCRSRSMLLLPVLPTCKKLAIIALKMRGTLRRHNIVPTMARVVVSNIHPSEMCLWKQVVSMFCLSRLPSYFKVLFIACALSP